MKTNGEIYEAKIPKFRRPRTGGLIAKENSVLHDNAANNATTRPMETKSVIARLPPNDYSGVPVLSIPLGVV